MDVTREIVIDLLPLYQSGEASADTRAAVEEYLRRDPSLRPMALGESTAPPPAPQDNAEREAIERARRRLRRRSWTLAIGVFCTLLPFTFGQLEGGPAFVLFRDVPWSRAFWIVAAVVWLDYLRLRAAANAVG